jgi:acyl-coenzyme A thioesterase PaaI-like protein
MRIGKKLFLKLVNFYPPFLGAGVKVKMDPIEPEVYHISMKLTRLNRNYVGVHFGGSLYSMVDPFYMLILMHKLGSDYIVWDKAACIEFKRPGRGEVRATFCIADEEVQEIKKLVDEHGKFEPEFSVDVLGQSGEVICQVKKTLWVKRRS